MRRQFQYLKQTAEELDPSVLLRIKLNSLYMSNETPEQTVRFVKENGIQTVAMPIERARLMPELVAALNEIGAKTFVHSANTQDEINEMRRRRTGIARSAQPVRPIRRRMSRRGVFSIARSAQCAAANPTTATASGLTRLTMTMLSIWIRLIHIISPGERQA